MTNGQVHRRPLLRLLKPDEPLDLELKVTHQGHPALMMVSKQMAKDFRNALSDRLPMFALQGSINKSAFCSPIKDVLKLSSDLIGASRRVDQNFFTGTLFAGLANRADLELVTNLEVDIKLLYTVSGRAAIGRVMATMKYLRILTITGEIKSHTGLQRFNINNFSFDKGWNPTDGSVGLFASYRPSSQQGRMLMGQRAESEVMYQIEE